MELNKEQKAALEPKDGIIALIAGAGSGKTKTLVERVLSDIKRGVDPQKMAVMTFTNAGAQEFRERLGSASKSLNYCGTLHGWALRLIAADNPNLQIIDERELKEVIKFAVERLKVQRGTHTHIFDYLCNGTTPRGKIGSIVRSVRAELVRDGKITVSMMLHEAFEIVKSKGLKPFDSIYVDEFQDSAPIDSEIYKQLNAKMTFVVGDPDQAIYGFRGGTVAGLMDFANTGKTLFLETCYRCKSEVTKAAQHVIEHATDRIEKSLKPANDGGTFLNVSFKNEHAEVQQLISALKGRLSSVDASEIAVLTRYNHDADELAQTLSGALGEPVHRMGKRSTGDQKKNLMGFALLRNPTEENRLEWQRVFGGKAPTNIDGDFASKLKIVGLEVVLADQIGKEFPDWSNTAEENFSIQQIIEKGALVDQPKNSIRVGTIHSAKGLEFDSVFIPKCDSKDYPLNDETAKLLFVAITRSKSVCVVTHSSQKKGRFTRDIKTVNASPLLPLGS